MGGSVISAHPRQTRYQLENSQFLIPASLPAPLQVPQLQSLVFLQPWRYRAFSSPVNSQPLCEGQRDQQVLKGCQIKWIPWETFMLREVFIIYLKYKFNRTFCISLSLDKSGLPIHLGGSLLILPLIYGFQGPSSLQLWDSDPCIQRLDHSGMFTQSWSYSDSYPQGLVSIKPVSEGWDRMFVKKQSILLKFRFLRFQKNSFQTLSSHVCPASTHSS